MITGTTAHTVTETIALTEVEKEFYSYVIAQEKIQLAIDATAQEIHAIAIDKIKQFAKDVAATAKVDADRASAICKEIKTTEQKIVEKKDGLVCVLQHVKEYVRSVEEQNCHAALRVWKKIQAELIQSQKQQEFVRSQILRLEEACEKYRPEQAVQQQAAAKAKA